MRREKQKLSNFLSSLKNTVLVCLLIDRSAQKKPCLIRECPRTSDSQLKSVKRGALESISFFFFFFTNALLYIKRQVQLLTYMPFIKCVIDLNLQTLILTLKQLDTTLSQICLFANLFHCYFFYFVYCFCLEPQTWQISMATINSQHSIPPFMKFSTNKPVLYIQRNRPGAMNKWIILCYVLSHPLFQEFSVYF